MYIYRCREGASPPEGAPTPREEKPQGGDPIKAQGAQPCKGDQTLGKLEPKGQSPTGATLTTSEPGVLAQRSVRPYFFLGLPL